ncbi:MAG TPA: glycoside hydrolase family 38 C-terminal domain-containing protein [Candidatus Baltobacteraceae bacterium]|nr:glycoside hydrolase family 38 C-terminal domain-containing protein [Candidatus Baltobacteraceae bacterium]
MRLRFARRAEDEAIVVLGARAALPPGPLRMTYGTRTGALLRVDGVVHGAFDLMHRTIDLPPLEGERDITLEVEKRSLPTHGLPSGGGIHWKLLLALARQRPGGEAVVEARDAVRDGRPIDVPLVGHAHLDVAWLWTYDATKRKALRTFATALRELETDGAFVFAQSQPQLYAWAFAADPRLEARIRPHVGERWDASVASMWVEPDLHAPSGESVLRQFAHGIAWAREHFGVEPTVAWLPDTFGFPSTFPKLAAHAGVPYFLTTKLEWNDTTRWPHPRFRWFGEDGSLLISAVVAGYDGELTDRRLRRARERGDLLVIGYGDGGGGVTDRAIGRVAPDSRAWTRVDRWFERELAGADLPEHRGELYLENHRGTYTTHHALKARAAELERALDRAEELAAWCVAIRAPKTTCAALVDDLRSAWRILMRTQFHDVISGSSIGAVYTEAHGELDRALRIVARVAEAAQAVLPRGDVRLLPPAAVEPQRDGDAWIVANEWVRARVRDDGIIVELSAADGPNVVALANAIAAYVDRPRAWDAWNVDRSYRSRSVLVRPAGASVEDGGVVARLTVGKASPLSMRVAAHEGEPWLRVEIAVGWQERHVLLRAEHRIALRAREARFGEQHGTIVRSTYPQTDEERAKFEVPAQRWAHVADDTGGLAIFTPDLYGWNAEGLKDGGVMLGTSLLRAPRWPDPNADRGEQRLEYALVPTAGATISALEHGWNAYATEERVRLFTCEETSVLIVATYPSDDASGVIVRVRECDGAARRVALRCGARMREAICVDAVERPVDGEARIVEEHLVFELGAYALRSFLVRF